MYKNEFDTNRLYLHPITEQEWENYFWSASKK